MKKLFKTVQYFLFWSLDAFFFINILKSFIWEKKDSRVHQDLIVCYFNWDDFKLFEDDRMPTKSPELICLRLKDPTTERPIDKQICKTTYNCNVTTTHNKIKQQLEANLPNPVTETQNWEKLKKTKV